jgi:hypothetical protein
MARTHFSGPVTSAGGFEITEGTAMATPTSRQARFSAPIAAELISIVADVAMSNVALTIAAQPDYPRKLRVRITDADSSVSAGTVTIVGKDQNGTAVSEVVTLTGGTATKVTTKAYSHVTSATVASLAGNTGSDHISIGVDTALGLPTGPGFTGFAVHKANAQNADEAVGTVDATAGTVVPTTAADGAKNFEFWYTANVPVV